MLDYVRSTDGGEAVSSPQYLGEGDSGLMIVCDVSTNTVSTLYTPPSRLPDSSVEGTFAYASSHYVELLRRLAD